MVRVKFWYLLLLFLYFECTKTQLDRCKTDYSRKNWFDIVHSKIECILGSDEDSDLSESSEDNNQSEESNENINEIEEDYESENVNQIEDDDQTEDTSLNEDDYQTEDSHESGYINESQDSYQIEDDDQSEDNYQNKESYEFEYINQIQDNDQTEDTSLIGDDYQIEINYQLEDNKDSYESGSINQIQDNYHTDDNYQIWDFLHIYDNYPIDQTQDSYQTGDSVYIDEMDEYQSNNETICGTQVIKNNQIVGDTVAQGEFPWLVYFVYVNVWTMEVVGMPILCSGSLISSNYVLTVAECVYANGPGYLSLIEVVLGLNTPCDNSCLKAAQHVGIAEIRHHPGFLAGNPNNKHDIVLLKLEKEIKFSRTIRPICLYPGTIDESHTYWSSDWFPEGESSKIIKTKVALSFMEPNKCWTSTTEKISYDFSCAMGENDKYICSLGAPLMTIINGRWYLAGASVIESKCCSDSPQAFFNINRLFQWIKSCIK